MRMRQVDANARAIGEKMEAEEGGLFEAAVSAVLRGWPALKMAVSNQFGGPQSQAKALWMEGATTQWMRENGEWKFEVSSCERSFTTDVR